MNSALAATPSCDHALNDPPGSPGGEPGQSKLHDVRPRRSSPPADAIALADIDLYNGLRSPPHIVSQCNEACGTELGT